MNVPLIVHVVHRLGVGGLENGLVNLINHMPAGRYRHAIVCLTEYTRFRERIRRDDIECFALGKRPGQDPGMHRRLWKLLRRLQPAIVHTRNVGTLECAPTAWAAGVRVRIHGEHGRDMLDLRGDNRRYVWLRRVYRPFVTHYVTVSQDLARWLEQTVGVPGRRISQIYNGVEFARFRPADGRAGLPRPGFAPEDAVVIGTVGRLQGEKDPLNLARAFIRLVDALPEGRERLRLVFVGDGPLCAQTEALLRDAGCEQSVWFAGERDDVPELLRGLDVFVLPSLAEGISNTVLEAMASGLPVVATRVGGNPELVEEGRTGLLVPPADPAALAEAIRCYVERPERRRADGTAARTRIETEFSMARMVQRYLGVYDRALGLVARFEPGGERTGHSR